MIVRLRRRHRWMVVVLAIVAGVGLAVALAVRRPRAVMPAIPAELATTADDGAASP